MGIAVPHATQSCQSYFLADGYLAWPTGPLGSKNGQRFTIQRSLRYTSKFLCHTREVCIYWSIEIWRMPRNIQISETMYTYTDANQYVMRQIKKGIKKVWEFGQMAVVRPFRVSSDKCKISNSTFFLLQHKNKGVKIFDLLAFSRTISGLKNPSFYIYYSIS